MAALVANVSYRQHRLGSESALHAEAPLVADRWLVIANIHACDPSWVNRKSHRRTRRESDTRVSHRYEGGIDLEAERNIRTGVVHVVALNALVHDAESAADNRLAASREVPGKADARTKGIPMIVDEALRYAHLSRDADAVQIERNAGKNRIGASAKSRAARADRAVWQHDRGVGRVIELGIEIPHAVGGFVSVRNAIPTQAEVKSQLAVHAPVILSVGTPRNVIPLPAVLHG